MDAADMVSELLEYFSGSYSPTLLRKIRETCDNIDAQDRRRVIEQVEEDNTPNFKLGIKAIADACRKLSIAYHRSESHYVPAIDWTCDACGLGFKYALVVTYEDKHDRCIFDNCPRCGFSPSYTQEAQYITRMQRGKVPARYDEWKAFFLNRLNIRIADERRKPSGARRYKGWMFDRQEDDDFTDMRRREEIDAMKAEAHEAISSAAAMKKIETERGRK